MTRHRLLPANMRVPVLLFVSLAAALAPAAISHADSPPGPDITVSSPAGGSTITSWAPSVDWGDAVVCKYSYDDSTYTDVDCAGDGSDIPAPAPGTVNFYLRADNSDDIETGYWTTFTYDPPPVAGWNSQPSQASPSDASITVDVHVNDGASNPVTYTVEYSLNGGDNWSDAGHLSNAAFPISGNTITGITTYGDGVNNRSNVAFRWDYTLDASTASTTNAEIRVTPSDANSSGEPIVSDPFALRAPPAPPVFAGDSGAVTDITENSAIVHYDMSSIGSAQLTHFELHYASDAYYTAQSGSYAENSPVTYTSSFSDSGATNVDGLSCGTEYHFIQSFTNGDGQTATSSDATFTTSDCTGDSGGDDDGGDDGDGYAFSAGDGTADNPYVIESCEDLAGINDYLGASFVLDTDLDCSEMGNSAMIGNLDENPPLGNSFTGTFDGGGHAIKVDLELSAPAVGLFRTAHGATIRDLAIASGSLVFGEEGVGSIVGVAIDSTLANVSSAATVVANATTPEYPLVGAGGIVGDAYGSSIDGATFTGIVGAPLIAGGIAGLAYNDFDDGPGAIISRSHAGGQILGAAGIGGIIGEMDGGAQVRNSYASAQVGYYPDFATGVPVTGGFGGIVGIIGEGVISRSYASGLVAGGVEDDQYPAGGLAGFVASGAVIVHSFTAASTTSSGAPVAGFIGGADESDGAFAGLYDDYFDTVRTGQTACAAGDHTSYDGCNGVDGSADGYWLGTTGTPLSAWDRASVWDVSGNDEEFPVLRAVSGPMPEESDEFTGADSGGSDDSEEPSHPHHRSHKSSSSIASLFPTAAGQGTLSAQLADLAAQSQSLLSQLAGTVGAPPAGGRDLDAGATGSDVTALQTLLISRGYAIPAGATGYFGAQTKAALAAYQHAHGIAPAAGYFGPLTRAAMKAAGLSGLWW